MSKINTVLSVVKDFKNWYTFFLDHAGLIKKGTIIYRLRNGVKFKVKSGTLEKGFIREVWSNKFYTPKGFEIRDGDTVVDIGAQVGIFTVFASKHAKKGKVFSFEPVKDNYRMLLDNISINRINNSEIINQAVGDVDGEETIFLSPNTGGHSVFKSGKSKEKIVVPMISMKSLMEKNNLKKIDFLKMDCEGAEYKILYNCPGSILKKIDKISMEYHNIDDKNNIDSLKQFLEKNGFKVRVNDVNCTMLYAFRNASSPE